MTATIQSLCISIPDTLLHMTLKRRAEISADIFARLLRYFFLSCKNLTIITYISVAKIAKVTKGCKIRLSSFKGIKVARGVKVAKRVAKVAKS